MMNVDLICVGKLNAAYCAEGVAEYQKRLGAYCRFRIVELPEETIREKNASQSVIDKALEKEGAAILAQVKRGAALVALCVEGKQLSSEELAGWIEKQGVGGCGDLAFVIGSSHGLAPAVKVLAEAAQAGPIGAETAQAAADAAWQAFENTRGMLARHGRMAIRGEASRELLDPGAAVAALLMKGYAEFKADSE